MEFRLRQGRRKAALPADAEMTAIALKKWLRGYIGETSLEQVASRARYSISAVSTAVGGAGVPSLQLVRGIADAVGAPAKQAAEMWWAAALAEFTKHNPPCPDDPLASFAQDLRKVMLKAGLGQADVLYRMARLSAENSELDPAMSRATLSRFLSGRCLPRHGQMMLLLRVLPLQDEEAARLKSRYGTLETALRMAKSMLLKAHPAMSEAR
ncbi:hypothetical protein ACFQ68_13200 [Amycolatopsis japonica]|uniref:hypothetical protein n=1 Tax=Amycolatopsis japonica TaxID=208439 RepID=UPI00367269DC